METNPFNDVGANWIAAVDALCDTVALENAKPSFGHAQLANATAHPLPDDAANAFITDPPYYDAVPYADLSDFFFVWLRRTLGDLHPALFRRGNNTERRGVHGRRDEGTNSTKNRSRGHDAAGHG